MKCPGCKYVLSDANDICTQCLLDLRSYKEEIGLPISHPDLSYQEIINLKFGSKKKKKKKKKAKAPQESEQGKQKTKGIVQSLFDRVFSSSKSAEQPAADSKQAKENSPSEQVYDILTEAQQDNTFTASSAEVLPEEAAPQVSAVEEVASQADAVPLQQERPAVVPAAVKEAVKETVPAPEKPLPVPEDITPVVTKAPTEVPALPDDLSIAESLLEETTVEAEETALEEESQLEEPIVAEPVPKNKTAPAVQEFTDDSDDFDEYLNSILGDTEIQIEAVKTKPVDYGIKKDEDLPFEFEVEFEDDEDDDDDDEYDDYEP